MDGSFDEDDRYTGRLDWSIWRDVGHRMLVQRRFVVGMIVVGVVVAIVDASLPALAGLLVDTAVAEGWGDSVWRLLIAYGFFVVLLGPASIAFTWCAGRIATGVTHDLRRDGFAKLQELSFAFFDTRPVGWLVSRLMGDVAKIADMLPWLLLDLVWGTSLIVGSMVMMIAIDGVLALWVLSIVPPLVVVSVVFQRRLLRSSREVRRINSQMTAAYAECIAGVRTTRALGREEQALAGFERITDAMEGYSVRRALESAVYLPQVMALGSVGVAFTLWHGGARVGTDVSLGTLVAFVQYATLFFMPVRDIAQKVAQLQGAQAAAERVQMLLVTESAIQDDSDVRAALERWSARDRPANVAFDGGDAEIEEIHFDNVGFSYVEGEPVLQSINFKVLAGQTVALVGPTGGGKSTIVSVLARFYDVQHGAIRINGLDHRKRSLHWLQSNLGVVLQSPHLFTGTVEDNIRYGRLEASDDEVRRAARRVGADSMIRNLTEGYSTQVGEGGARLSTGQRQLVSLARAVLADPQIFIMDEATSSLDAQTEAAVQAGVDAVLEGRVAFVIAHRLSTIRRADLILVVDGGRIVERGTHLELLNAGGRYAQLHARSHATQIIREVMRNP